MSELAASVEPERWAYCPGRKHVRPIQRCEGKRGKAWGALLLADRAYYDILFFLMPET